MSAADDPDRTDPPRPGRRSLLKLAGAFGALPLAPALPAAAEDMAGMKMPAAKPAAAPKTPGYLFFNADEAAFIEAAVDTFIPADDYGPAGTELGVAVFVDRQLDSGYGRGDRMYLQGPFVVGTPEQGYQLQLTPAELMRAGMLDMDAHLQETRKSSFDALGPAERAQVLTDLEHHRITFATVPSASFFQVLFQLVMDGFFCDPLYGGNLGKASWKMLGYPGVGEMYANKIEKYRNTPYVVEPKSIQDFA